MGFKFTDMPIPGVLLITPDIFEDKRGFFMEAYKYSEFAANGISETFIQDNHSKSSKNTIRGLHYQLNPHAQGKLIKVIEGEVFDVAVDIRQTSQTFGNWVSSILSSDNKNMLYIPPWCAHGFCVISGTAQVLYKTTNEYAPESEAGIVWNDPDIGITWPCDNPILSPKDSVLPLLVDAI